MADILAAMLYAQLQHVEEIVALRGKVTQGYIDLYAPYEKAGCLRIPHPPAGVALNHHSFFVIFDSADNQKEFLKQLRTHQVNAYIGYVPLHSFKKGLELGYRAEDLPITEDLASRIVRLPFYTDLATDGLDYTLDCMKKVLSGIYGV